MFGLAITDIPAHPKNWTVIYSLLGCPFL